MSSEIAGVLYRAADLIEPAGAWTQGEFARDAGGRACDAWSPNAACFCVHGARKAAAKGTGPGWGTLLGGLAGDFVRRALGVRTSWHVTVWHDRPERTQAEAVQLLRDAAKLAEQEATDAR